MSLPRDLLAQAGFLASKEPRRPSQANLRRGVSAAYYALYHLLVDEAAKRMVPTGDRVSLRNCLKRAFDHGNMKKVARQFAQKNVSRKLSPELNDEPLQPETVRVATTFSDLQQLRHEADYNMTWRFTRQEVLALIRAAYYRQHEHTALAT